jgi:hypothetical protein
LAKRAGQFLQADRVVGFFVANETGTHHFCNGCVKSDDPTFGTLHEIRANQKEARYKCSLCDRRIKLVNGTPPRSARFLQELQEFYRGQVPDYILEAGRTYLIVQILDYQSSRRLKITVNDFAAYRATSWGASGIRTLAGYSGDWRQIDNLADEVLGWFMHISIAHLRREVRNVGLEVWF